VPFAQRVDVKAQSGQVDVDAVAFSVAALANTPVGRQQPQACRSATSTRVPSPLAQTSSTSSTSTSQRRAPRS
jgi:hypothetical protein